MSPIPTAVHSRLPLNVGWHPVSVLDADPGGALRGSLGGVTRSLLLHQ